MAKQTRPGGLYYEFDVYLFGVRPRPWRRFLIRPTASFHALHAAIQAASEWKESHLYCFYPARVNADPPIAGISMEDGGYDEADGDPFPDARNIRVDQWFHHPGDHCRYAYDFGDGWICGVDFTDYVRASDSFTRRLVAGEEAFPPDDCGGTHGYELLLAGLAGSGDPEEAEELRKWAAGMDWSPTFDLDRVRARFDRPKRRK